MAKKSKIVREHKLIKKVQKYAALRAELKVIIRSQESSSEEKQAAVARLDNLPKSSSHIRIRNRCFKTGRPRGVIRRFNLSRISFREMALRGEIPWCNKSKLVGEKYMSMTDPIADLLTRIRNGLSAKKRWVDIPSSNFKKRIVLVLKEESYIEDFFFISDGGKEKIRVFLKYDFKGNSVIESIKRVSRPGLRVYVGVGEAPRVLDGLGISILSTSKGVLSNKAAKKRGVGGEIICEVY